MYLLGNLRIERVFRKRKWSAAKYLTEDSEEQKLRDVELSKEKIM